MMPLFANRFSFINGGDVPAHSLPRHYDYAMQQRFGSQDRAKNAACMLI